MKSLFRCQCHFDGNELSGEPPTRGECAHHAQMRRDIEALRTQLTESEARRERAEAAIRLQANAMRSYKSAESAIAAGDRRAAEQLRAESSPEALESERAANAVLTEENAQLRAELAAYERALEIVSASPGVGWQANVVLQIRREQKRELAKANGKGEL